MNRFRLPYHLLVEEGIFSRVNEVMSDCVPGIGNKKVVIVTDQNLQKLFPETLKDLSLDFHNSEIYLVEDGSFDQAVDLAKYICMHDFTVVIGFGGGMVLDLAKYAAFVSKAIFLCLPTTLSNDSLASPVAVLGTEGLKRKTFRCTIPSSIIVDVNIIMGAPEGQLLAGVGDTISKYTALNDWKLDAAVTGNKIDDFAYMISKMAFNSICYHEEKSIKSKSFIKVLTQALVMGGLAMEIAGNSRPSSGAEHLFCHSLEENFADEVYVPHGIAVAMGSVPACIFQGRNIEKIKRILHEYRIPVKPSDWKVTEDIFIQAWQQAGSTRPDRYTILNQTELSDGRLSEIYREMEEEF
ncbi:MAG: iron-containing alcohol dehydrogenase family protein [Lachnospiraceae bacterium]|nr:iron-containing alcohol dehydrogenase family protein [Lachnospiraceae bacterium]MBP3505025.1 iron-containing alcohol dehydrogenase family protein [Lachnospiraceae bacterium]